MAEEEGALVVGLGVAGLLIPLCAIFAFAFGKPGKTGRQLGIAGLVLWGLSLLFVLSAVWVAKGRV